MIDRECFMYILFGLPTWVLVDGTWSILSQLSESLPESYQISSYLILALTIGNIIPLFIGGFLLRENSSIRLPTIIKSILIVGFITGLCLSLFWHRTISNYSIPLYILFFVVGTSSSSSNVTHFTYVSTSKQYNTTYLATGMGLGSMISGLLALIQGFVLINYGFTVSYYYFVLSLCYIPAFLMFVVLEKHKVLLSGDSDNDNQTLLKLTRDNHENYVILAESDNDHNEIISNSNSSITGSEITNIDDVTNDGLYNENKFLYDNYFVLSLQFFNSSLGYGLIPAMISYSCSKFDNRSIILLLATSIAALIDPICKGLTNYIRLKTKYELKYATLLLIFIAIGLICCAALPRNLSFYHIKSTSSIPVILYISFSGLFGFSNTCIFRYFKDNIQIRYIQHAYRWSGIACQSGALLGSLIAFSIVVSNVMN